MNTLGIDLSSRSPNTAACSIIWNDGGSVVVSPPRKGCSDATLDKLMETADVVGIDAPFGWPITFRPAVECWETPEWTESSTEKLRFRETDRATKKLLMKHRPNTPKRPNPLSVSTDKIALPAMRAMALLARQGVMDKSGDGRFFEVYPAATLAMWGLRHSGYKSEGKTKEKALEALQHRREMIRQLRMWLKEIPDAYAEDDHSLDALIASLSARAAALHWTFFPSEEAGLAKTEGWIHIPDPAKCQNAASLRT